jgi:hypothetical protein
VSNKKRYLRRTFYKACPKRRAVLGAINHMTPMAIVVQKPYSPATLSDTKGSAAWNL